PGLPVARAWRAKVWDGVIVEDAPSSAQQYAERVDAVRALGAELLETPTEARIRELAAGVELVVPSPLVRPGHPAIAAAVARGIVVRSEIDLAAERARVPIVAVTGPDGKTTVTTMG